MQTYLHFKQTFIQKTKIKKPLARIVFLLPNILMFCLKLLTNKQTPWQAKAYFLANIAWFLNPKKNIKHFPKIKKKVAFYHFLNSIYLLIKKSPENEISQNWKGSSKNYNLFYTILVKLKNLSYTQKLNAFNIIKIVTKRN